jgi:hypothetical protein
VGWNVEAGRNVTPFSPRTMHRRILRYSRRTDFPGKTACMRSLLGNLENLDLQEIAVQGPYSGVFASTPCSIFGLHKVDQDKAVFECSKDQAFSSA